MADEKISKVLLTGAAGFIGFYVARALIGRGIEVIGIDNLNDYYPVALKRARLGLLQKLRGFSFHEIDIADHDALTSLPGVRDVDRVVHLAAQAGVRYSLKNPFAYARSNLLGHLSILELVRHSGKNPLLVYASSSSVYGANTKVPFSEKDPVNQPVSLYAATKRADELLSESYAHLYGMRQIGLRFFTVYGPMGRPDMAYWTFTENILSEKPIQIFNNGDLERDFTYIEDIVSGVISTVLQPSKRKAVPPHRVYNIGNNRPEKLMRFVEILEEAIGKKAIKEFLPMQQGDVHTTYADIDAISSDYGYRPTTDLTVGIPKFVDWYRGWRNSN